MLERIWFGALALAVACGCGSENFHKERSNDISLSVEQLLFKRPTQGRVDSEVKVVKISSAGDLPLKVEKIYLKEPLTACDRTTLGLGAIDPLPTSPDDLNMLCDYVIVERDELPKEMPNGDFIEVKLVFHRPAEKGPLVAPTPTATLVVESDATRPEDRQKEIVLQVEGEAPKIEAAPTVIQFPPDAPGDQTVLVRNVGTGTLRVDDVQLRLVTPQPVDASGQAVDEFVLDLDGALPWELGESESLNLVVKYTPFDDLADSAQITIKSNDLETPSLILTATSQPLQGLLQVDPVVANFELEGGAREATVYFTFTNNGLKPVNVYAMDVIQPANDYRLSTKGNGNTSFQLQPGGLAEDVFVTYHPLGDPTDAKLYISTDADNAAEMTPDLVAAELLGPKVIEVPLVHDVSTLPGVLSIDPLSAVLTDVQPGTSGQATITLSNSGGAPIAIRRIDLATEADEEVAGMASDPEFHLVSGGGAVTLASGDEHEIVVELTRAADDVAQHFGAIVIESDAGGSPHVVTLFADAPPETP